LMAAISRYNNVAMRIDAARLELTTAETAFQYRYVVVQEPEVPRAPVKPNRKLLILASIAGAFGLGLLVGAAKELASGRLIEVWQVRQLKLPVLGEVDLTSARHS
jgi:hypothetical protein